MRRNHLVLMWVLLCCSASFSYSHDGIIGDWLGRGVFHRVTQYSGVQDGICTSVNVRIYEQPIVQSSEFYFGVEPKLDCDFGRVDANSWRPSTAKLVDESAHSKTFALYWPASALGRLIDEPMGFLNPTRDRFEIRYPIHIFGNLGEDLIKGERLGNDLVLDIYQSLVGSYGAGPEGENAYQQVLKIKAVLHR